MIEHEAELSEEELAELEKMIRPRLQYNAGGMHTPATPRNDKWTLPVGGFCEGLVAIRASQEKRKAFGPHRGMRWAWIATLPDGGGEKPKILWLFQNPTLADLNLSELSDEACYELGIQPDARELMPFS